MKQGKFIKKDKLDNIQRYVANGVELHPLLYVEYMKQLNEMELKGKMCFTTETVFEQYHLKLKQAV